VLLLLLWLLPTAPLDVTLCNLLIWSLPFTLTGELRPDVRADAGPADADADADAENARPVRMGEEIGDGSDECGRAPDAARKESWSKLSAS